MSEQDDRTGSGPWDLGTMWALVDDVQRLTLQAAEAVVDQFRTTTNRMMGRSGGTSDGSSTARWQPDPAAVGPDVQRMIDAWVELMQSSWSAFASFMQSSGASPRSRGPATTSAAVPGVEHVDLPTARSGSSVEARLWVRNATAEQVSGVQLVATELVDASGDRLEATTIGFDPQQLDRIGAGESVPVVVRVGVPPETLDGTYHGVVVATTRPPSLVVVSVQVSAGS